MNDIIISVVITTFNRADFISKAIDSVLKQEREDIELIVVDDGSTDHTQEIVQSVYSEKLTYVKKENEERSIARNTGITVAKGEYINFLDSDDFQLSDHLITAIETIMNNGFPPIVHLGYCLKSTTGEMLLKRDDFDNSRLLKTMVKENILHCNAIFIKKEILEKYQFLNSKYAFLSEDWYLWMRLIVRFPVVFNNKVTSVVVEHEERSLNDINVNKLVRCTELIVSELKKDQVFISTLKGDAKKFLADQYTFLSLILSLSKDNKLSTVHYLRKAINEDLMVVLRKRFLASVKHLIMRSKK